MHRIALGSMVCCLAMVGGACSAVINPDPARLNDDAGGHGDGGGGGIDAFVPPGTDGGVPPADDAWTPPGVDAWVPPGVDGGPGMPDAWTAPPDAWTAPPDAWVPPSCAGTECPGWAAALAMAPRGATSLSNCVIQMHQSDCCGAMRAYGVNHAARSGTTGNGGLCAAETACDATYPTSPGCSNDVITTDTGESTINRDAVRLRTVNGMPCSFNPSITCYTCETFVCNDASCRSAPGISGGCG